MKFQYEGYTVTISLKQRIMWIIGICLLISGLFVFDEIFQFLHSHIFIKNYEDAMSPAVLHFITTLINTLHVWTDFALCSMLFAAALINYGFHKDLFVPVFGLSFLSFGVMNIFLEMTLLGAIPIEASSDYIKGFAWWEGRLFFANILVLGYYLARIANLLRIKSLGVVLAISALFFTTLLIGIIYYSLTLRPVLAAFFEVPHVQQPLELIPLAIFLLIALPVFISHARQSPSYLAYALILNLIPQVAAELFILFDTRAQDFGTLTASHSLELFGVLIVLEGLHQNNKLFYSILDHSRAKTERLSKAKDRFLGTLSYHLRTPLTNILGTSQVVLEGVDGELNERQHNSILSINQSAELLNLRINELIDVNKIDSGRIFFTPQQVDLNHVVQECESYIKPLLENKPIQFEMKLLDEPIKIISDPRRLKQVLIELVKNAAKYTQEGSINIECERTSEGVIISIRDTGPGIDPEILNQVFVEKSFIHHANELGGLGFGIAVSNKIANALGAKLSIECDKGTQANLFFDNCSIVQQENQSQNLGEAYGT